MTNRTYLFRTLALAGMEACWVYGWLLLLHHHACDRCLFIPGILAFGPAAFLIGRLLRNGRKGGALRQTLLWLLWLAAALLYTEWIVQGTSLLEGFGWLRSFPGRVFSIVLFPTPELLTLLGTALLWVLGQRLSGSFRDGSILLTEFQFGLSMILILLLLETLLDLHIQQFMPLTMIFFLFALTGLSMSLLQAGTDWSSSARRALWSGVVVGVICLVLAAGVLAVYLLNPDLMNRVVSVLEEILKWIGRWIARILSFLASFFPTPEPQRLNLPPPPPGVGQDPSIIAKFLRIPESVRKVGSFLVAAIWIFLFVGAIWTLSNALFKWLLQRIAQSEDSEVVPVSGAFKEDLRWLLKVLAVKMKRLYGSILRLFGRGASVKTPPSSARIIYRRLLRWAAARGFPRGLAQTPGEYLRTLVEKVPRAESAVSFITAHYVVERYSAETVAPVQVEEMEAKWKAVKRAKINQRSEISGQRSD